MIKPYLSDAYRKTKAAVLIALALPLLSACSHMASKSTTTSQAEATPAVAAPTAAKPQISWRNFPQDSLYQLLSAEVASQRKQYHFALKIYLQQAQQLQDLGLAKQSVMLAKYLKAYPQALAATQLWLKLEPKSASALANAAYIHSHLGEFDTAVNYLEQVQSQLGYANYAALAARSMGFEREQQVLVYQRLEQIQQLQSPNQSQQLDLNLARALLLKAFGQEDQALVLLEQNTTSRFSPREPEQGSFIRSLVLASEIKLAQAKQLQSLTRLRDFTQQHPQQMEARWHYARLLTSVDARAGKAEFAELRALAPKDQQVNFSYARLLFLQQEFAQAAIEFKPLLYSPRFRHQALYHLGLISARAGRYQQADQYLQEIGPSVEFHAATKARVGIFLQQQQNAQALELLEQARAIDSDNAIRYYLLEQDILNEQKQWQQSHDVLSQALNQHPDNFQLLYARAMVNERLDRLDILEQDLRHILQQDPNHSMALNALGYTLADRTERYQEALVLITQAYKVEPNDAAILDSMGWVHYRLGNLEQARAFLEQAIKQMPDPEIIAHYCEVLWFSQEQQKAKDLLQQALNKSPNHSILLQTQKRLGIRFAPDPLDDAAAKTAEAAGIN